MIDLYKQLNMDYLHIVDTIMQKQHTLTTRAETNMKFRVQIRSLNGNQTNIQIV